MNQKKTYATNVRTCSSPTTNLVRGGDCRSPPSNFGSTGPRPGEFDSDVVDDELVVHAVELVSLLSPLMAASADGSGVIVIVARCKTCHKLVTNDQKTTLTDKRLTVQGAGSQDPTFNEKPI